MRVATGAVAIVNVGALTDHKGQRWLIEAFAAVAASLPAARLWILGEGELRADLERQASELKLSARVLMPGFVPDARYLLSAFDVYVSSSHLEGLGTSILDAMLSGVPVVAASTGGVTDIVQNGVTGRLVPAREASALAEAIVAEIECPEHIREAMTQAARHSAEVNFSAERMVEGTLAVYRKMLAESNIAAHE